MEPTPKYQAIQHGHHLENPLVPLPGQSPSQPLQKQPILCFHHHRRVLLVLGSQLNGTTRYMLFWVRLPALGIRFLRFSHGDVLGVCQFLLLSKYPLRKMPPFVNSFSCNRHLSSIFWLGTFFIGLFVNICF